MHRVGAWLWRRHRRYFVAGMTAASALILGSSLIVPAVAIGWLYLGMTTGQAVAWAAAVVATTGFSIAVAVATLRRALRPIHRWAGGDDRDAAATWSALLRLPQRLGVRVFSVVLPLHLATSYPVALAVADPGLQGAVALLLAYLLVTSAGALLFTSATQLLVRAAASDVAQRLGATELQLARWWTIRRRLVFAVVVSTMAAGVGMPAVVLGGSATENDYLVAMTGGAAFAGYLAWLLDIGLFQPTVAPVRDLIEGTARVRRGDLSTPVPVSTPDELGDLAGAFNEMQVGLQHRESLHAAFGSYVDPALAERLLASGSALFAGEELVVTVLFLDVRDFTSFSEQRSPAEAVEVLNRLFDVVVPVLHEHGGHANHYLGDGLLAVFGAPTPMERHAEAAVGAAIAIQEQVRRDLGSELRLGIGINTGPVIAGTVGGGGRLEFTVIGDTVNAAARVEQLTKETGDPILITEATRAALTSPRPRTRRRGTFVLRGKSASLDLYAVGPSLRTAARSSR